MKKIGWLALTAAFLIMFYTHADAQKRRPRSTIRVTLSDDSPLTLAVNNRYYKKAGKRITLGDLPGKRPYFKIYKYRPFQDGKGGKAVLIFSGTVKIKPGKSYEAVVNVKNGKLSVREGIAPVLYNQPEDGEYAAGVPADIQMMPQLESLKAGMDRQAADMDKLKLAKAYADKNKYNTEDLADIASWLLFDDTKLAFLKYAYGKVENQKQYQSLESVFSTDESKNQFRFFLQSGGK